MSETDIKSRLPEIKTKQQNRNSISGQALSLREVLKNWSYGS